MWWISKHNKSNCCSQIVFCIVWIVSLHRQHNRQHLKIAGDGKCELLDWVDMIKTNKDIWHRTKLRLNNAAMSQPGHKKLKLWLYDHLIWHRGHLKKQNHCVVWSGYFSFISNELTQNRSFVCPLKNDHIWNESIILKEIKLKLN